MDLKKKIAVGFEAGKLFRGEFSPLWKMVHNITKVNAGKNVMRPMLSKVLVERDTVTYNAGQADETTGPVMRVVATDLHRLVIMTFKPGQEEALPLLDAGLYEFVCAPSSSAGVLLRAFEGEEPPKGSGKSYPDYRRVLPDESEWGDVIGTYQITHESTGPMHGLRINQIGEGFGLNLLYLPEIRNMDCRDNNNPALGFVYGWSIQSQGKNKPFRFVGYYRGVRVDYIVMPLNVI